MKAALVEEEGKLVVREIPPPEAGEYDLLCEMLYGATCTGTDTHIIDGTIPFTIEYPTVLGHESIGRVVEVGSKVRNFKPGDLVTRVGAPPSPAGEYASNWGGFAEFGIARDHWAMCRDGLPREEWDAFRVNQHLPTGIDPKGATMVITWRETLSYLNRMGLGAANDQNRVLVIGSGGNGLAFAAHAVNLGCSPVVMIGNRARENKGAEAGADGYFDYRDESLVEKIRREYPLGFDFIIDAVGKEGALDQVLPLLSGGGRVGIYGLDDADKTAVNPRKAQGAFSFYSGEYDEEETHHQVLSCMRRGRLRAELWLDMENTFELDSIQEAFKAVRNRESVKALVEL